MIPTIAGMSTRVLCSIIAGLAASAAACGGDAPPSGSDIAARVSKVCTATSNLTSELCTCIGQQAAETLAPAGQRFLIAMLEKNDALMETAKREASIADAAAAGTFMVRASATCARRQHDNREGR